MSPTGRRLSVFVTVGMGPWPFDRLLLALPPVCAAHDVFAQTGTSTVRPPCPHEAYLGFAETQRRIAEADVVITHGGNTVRLVQRAGKVPIAVAREAARGEMRNDHQSVYLRGERARDRAVVLDGELRGLAAAVDQHLAVQEGLLRAARPLDQVDPAGLANLLDRTAVSGDPAGNPFVDDPTARYRWAFDQLRDRVGRHLDVGIGDAEFLRALQERTGLQVVGVDPHRGYLAAARQGVPDAGGPGVGRLAQARDQLPFGAETYDSVTLLDVLEHTADEAATLREVHRVLRPGGLLLLTVPALHALSFLDPDNVKFRWPGVHRAVYSARFGADRYHERFVDDSDGLRGDMAWERREHTNYRAGDLLQLLEATGFVPRERDGANLFWRVFQVPALLAPGRGRRLFDAPLRADGRWFRSANLFVAAVRSGGGDGSRRRSS